MVWGLNCRGVEGEIVLLIYGRGVFAGKGKNLNSTVYIAFLYS